MTMTKKNDYCPPLTTRLEVHLESGICAASKEEAIKEETSSVTIEMQDPAEDFTAGGWD